MYRRFFEEVDLTVIELPIDTKNQEPLYTVYLKELPFLSGEGDSWQTAYHMLARMYQEYREKHLVEVEETEEHMTTLTIDELLKYYDGETLDSFSDYF